MRARSHKGSLAHSFDVGKLSTTLARSSSRVWAHVFSVRSGSECRASSRTSRVPLVRCFPPNPHVFRGLHN